jgi:PAS domain S-box-containing protein
MFKLLKSGFSTIKNNIGFLVGFLLFFLIFVVGSFVVKNSIYKISEERLSARFLTETSTMLRATQDKIEKYDLLLKSARSLFYSSKEITRAEWEAYGSSLDISANYPSLTEIAYVRRVLPLEKNEFIDNVRLDKSINPKAYPDFDITPKGDSDEYYIVDYLYPLNGNEEAFGFNVFSDSARRMAIELARDTGLTAITEPIMFIQEKGGEKGFLMLLPVYKNDKVDSLEGRRDDIQGFILAAVGASDLFSQIVLSIPLTSLSGLSVTDVTDNSAVLLPYIDVLGRSTNDTGENIPTVQTSRISIGSRTWRINFRSDTKPQIDNLGLITPYALSILGFVISLLIALVLLNSARLKSKAEKLAKDLTKDLEKFKLAVENSSDHIVITDAEGNIVYANKSVERITGFLISEVMGKKAGSKSLWGGQMDSEVYKKFWHQIKVEKKSFSGEFNNHRKNGEQYVVEANISPILDQNNEVIFFVGIERDITKAKEIDKMKDEFVSVASHELRTPMTAIKGLVSMILEGDYGEVGNKLLQPLGDIALSTNRLIHLVNDMLNLSRIESGRLKFTLKEFDPTVLIGGVVESLNPIAKQKGIILKVGTVSKAKILGDEDKISQVLNNLIGNSLKFTDKGSIVVDTETNENFLKIFVKDTGVGIVKEDVEKIFGKFEQISSIQKGRPQGTGLGLYISKQIANKLGGDVWLEKSELGKGSVFGFSLPLMQSKIAEKIKAEIAKEEKNNPNQKEMS